MPVVIPRTATRRRERGYALLVLRPSRSLPCIFDGKLLATGSLVDESALWPSPHYPLIPLLVEYAGNDGSGRGHTRSKDIHVLWRYARERREFDELARVASSGPEWFHYLAPIVEREMVRPAVDHAAEARAASGRLAALIDGELDQLADEGREQALSFLYDQVAARLALETSATAEDIRRATSIFAGSGLRLGPSAERVSSAQPARERRAL